MIFHSLSLCISHFYFSLSFSVFLSFYFFSFFLSVSVFLFLSVSLFPSLYTFARPSVFPHPTEENSPQQESAHWAYVLGEMKKTTKRVRAGMMTGAHVRGDEEDDQERARASMIMIVYCNTRQTMASYNSFAVKIVLFMMAQRHRQLNIAVQLSFFPHSSQNTVAALIL